MSPKMARKRLMDGSFVDTSIEMIKPDQWRPHGVRYRVAWIQDGNCRVLFDNHHGKSDHFHVDRVEHKYKFQGIERLFEDFEEQMSLLGGRIQDET